MTHTTQRFAGASAALLAGLALIALGALALGSDDDAAAIAPCLLHQNTAEELEFIGLLQDWRAQNVSGSVGLQVSAPLNAAAAGYAEFLANTPGAGGHSADGAGWVERANQCGFYSSSSGATGGGEGLAAVEASFQVSVPPSAALDVMAAEFGGGIYIPGDTVKCVGAAKAVSADGTKVVWVALLFQLLPSAGPDCPQQVANGEGGETPTETATATQTATETATATASATPTATPTQTATPAGLPGRGPFKAYVPYLARND